MMIGETSWEPSASDIAWQDNMIRVLKDGAVWGVPASESAFVINKNDREFSLTAGDPNHETNKRIAKVFKFLGYAEVQHSSTSSNEGE